jgi:DNA-directed RNA polymerase II subunit RPB1
MTQTTPNKILTTYSWRSDPVDVLIFNPRFINLVYSFIKDLKDLMSPFIINSILNSDVYFDEIMNIEEVQPSTTYVYDFTVEDTQNFNVANGLCMRDSFHNSGVGGLGGANLGVPRIKEIFSLSKNPKEPVMYIYIDKNHKQYGKKDFANKIASHIKYTTIQDLRNKLEIFYDPKPYEAGGFMEKDNVYNIFYSFQQSKTCCQSKIDGLPWLMRIEFDKEKLLNKEVTLLDIKSQFCVAWDKRYQDVKGLKREKRQLLEKITQLAIITNTDNDDIPIMHIRFDMTNFNSVTLVDFMDMFVDSFKLKGMSNIDDIRGGKPSEERMISFDNPEQSFEKNNEYVIYTKGINMIDIRKIIGVDLNRTFCSDVITTYEIFGIEAARNLIIRDIIAVFTSNGSAVNYQHISVFGDLMTNVGNLTSIDRHGLNKLDTDPFSRASFEKTVEQLITAAIFNEVDHMKSVSSRIMAGLCIKGGTGLCNLILDRELLENSEYTTDIGQLYQKTYEDILPSQNKQEVDTDVFIPEL